MKSYILRAGSDRSFVYGILRIEKDVNEMTLQKELYSARKKAMDNNQWSIEDALVHLPEDWNATLKSISTLFV